MSSCFEFRSSRLGTLALIVSAAQLFAAAPKNGDVLRFFNNWFVTGDYAAAGVGLKGTSGAGKIALTSVPCTVGEGTSAAIGPCGAAGAVPAYPVAAFLYWQNVESGAQTASKGKFNGFDLTGVALLDADSTSACFVSTPRQHTLRSYRADVLRFLPFHVSGGRQANGLHDVKLGAAVAGNGDVVTTLGATLVVIYRVAVAGKPQLAPLRSVVVYDGQFTLTKQGPDMTQTVAGWYQPTSGAAPRMTMIAGNGQKGFRETVKVGNGNQPGSFSGNEPFLGADGASWDTLTFGFDLRAADASIDIRSHVAGGSSNCLSWGAIVASTNVQDSDSDGLLDIWETRGLHRNVNVYPATFGTCADYPSEPCVNLPAMGAVNGVRDIFMQVDWLFGQGMADRPAHSHAPKLDALKMVAGAFAANRVALHFDVGNRYQGLGLSYIIPAALAKGGANIDEDSLACLGPSCAYPGYPALSFKLGFASVRDGNKLLGLPQRFSQDRKDIFRYVLFAHALAGPFDANFRPIPDPFNPGSPLPRSYSGIADRPGGDILVTLGLWRSELPENDQVGGALVQAGTLMHEIGHVLNLSHGGLKPSPNCAPNYPSVMSYLYQTRGLIDGLGVPQVDFSAGRLAALNENALSSNAALGALKYRLRYYSPLGSASPGQAAKRHCDGSAITDNALLIRQEAAALTVPDWGNGTTETFIDVNFDGIRGQQLFDQPDWASIDLRQIGSRANFGSVSVGSIATDAGSIATDAGSIATDAGSIATDAGSIATDAGSIATDAGSIATDAGSIATDAGDEDYDSHILTTTDGIPTPQQCPNCGLKAANGLSDIKLSWTPPETGGNLVYNIYRCRGANCNPAQGSALFKQGHAPASKVAPEFVDAVNDTVNSEATCPANKTCYNTLYTYVVTAVSQGGLGTESPYSNIAASKVTRLFVVAQDKSVVYGNPLPAPTFTVLGENTASLNTSSVSCSYPVPAPRNAGEYAITCAGPVTVTPTNGVDYQQPYLTFVPGKLTITKRTVTVTASSSNKTYDGTTASAGVPLITAGSLAYDDSALWSQVYASRNAGTHSLIPNGTVSDGNGGNNYIVAFANASGTIDKLAVTISATPADKTYDGTTGSTVQPSTTPGLATGDTAALTQTYSNRNAGSRTLTPAATIYDGNGGSNYLVTFANAVSAINPRPITVAAVSANKTYDGTTVSNGVPAIAGGLGAGDSVSSLNQSYNDPNAGLRTLVPAVTISDGNGGANYQVTPVPASGTILKAAPTISVTPYDVVYDGTPKRATGTASGVGNVDLSSGLNLNGTEHTEVGTYANDPWTFTDPTGGNYENASGTVTNIIRTNAVDLTTLALARGEGNEPPLFVDGALRMANETGQRSAAWWTKKPVAAGFSTTFKFKITRIGEDSLLADGLVFVIQNSGNTALGSGGGDIGYAGIPNSLAVEFDTFTNSDRGDPLSPHVGIQSNGAGANTADHSAAIAVHTPPVVANFADGNEHTARVTYNGTTLRVFLDGTLLIETDLNLASLLTLDNGTAFVGFTAATGASREITDLVSWTWNN